MALGLVLMIGGAAGTAFIYKHVAQENISTPSDAFLPNHKVRGPISLKAQADIIRQHTLKTTEGKTFSQMPSKIPKLDQNGQPILGEDGKALTTENTARNIWVTANTLITALNLAILAYAFCALSILLGVVICLGGVLIYHFHKK